MSGQPEVDELASPRGYGRGAGSSWWSLALSVAVALVLAVAAALVLGGFSAQTGAAAGGERGCGATGPCCLSGEAGGQVR